MINMERKSSITAALAPRILQHDYDEEDGFPWEDEEIAGSEEEI